MKKLFEGAATSSEYFSILVDTTPSLIVAQLRYGLKCLSIPRQQLMPCRKARPSETVMAMSGQWQVYLAVTTTLRKKTCKFHPYKMKVVQELLRLIFACCQNLLEVKAENPVVLFSVEEYFHYQVETTNKTCAPVL